MSNHAGSYLLNEVLQLLERRGVFDFLGKEGAQELVLEIVRLSGRYDCNPGEILDGVGERLAICPWCMSPRADLVEGICRRCRDQWSADQ